MRLPFYSAPPEGYLFATKLLAHGANEREEPVRQWCAFELIRAYGNTVSDLSFEEEVRVGSKIYRIDILVRRNGLPWVVVECKEPKHTKYDEGMDQAISYAGSVAISAEYALYTNGTAWLVKRKVDDSWQAVPDIPISGPGRTLGSIDELWRTVELVSPLLHKLDQPLAGNDARIFLAALQRFFCGPNLIMAQADHDLRSAADNLLRVLSTGRDDRHYSRSKLSIAASCAERFRAKTGIGFPLAQIHEEESGLEFMPELAGSLHPFLEAGRGIGGVNEELVRLILSLLEYGRTQARDAYPLFPAHLHASMRSFLTKAMALSLDVVLPEALEEAFTSDVKHYTRSAWEELVKNDATEQKEMKRYFFSALWHSLAFWRSARRR